MQATCHPDRESYSKGRCSHCYDKDRYHNNPARKESTLRRVTAWYAANKDHVYYREAEKKFNLTREQHQEIFLRQGGVCAICGKEPTSRSHGRLQIDHNHRCCPGRISCGKCVRGLLCLTCNYGLGQFKDSIEILERVCAFLEAHQ
jgi:hypothetical protein